MVRPLKLLSTYNFQEMSDSDITFLSYELRKAYAVQLDSNLTGSIYIGAGSDDSIGEMVDTISTEQTAHQARNNSGGADWPDWPGIGNAVGTHYKYKQRRVPPAWPGDSIFDKDGLLGITGAGNISLIGGTGLFSNLAANGLDSHLFVPTILQMRDSSGDNVGTYKIATSQPEGKADWKEQFTIMIDTTYDDSNAGVYKL